MRRNRRIWLAAAALTTLLWCGCAGILSESTDDAGRKERLRLSTTDRWNTWDRNATKQNESSFILKKESTF